MKYDTIGVTRNELMEYAISILDGKIIDLDCKDRKGWIFYHNRFKEFLNTGIPQFSIFTKGNSKLPFYSYSTLPAINCPGAGECLTFCYSFKAWRYPAAFFRQLQNTILERYSKDHILQSALKLKHGSTIRLYVDGDINTHNIEFWKEVFNTHAPDLKVYGYSKSLQLIIDHAENWPKNWLLNLSSGHNANNKTEYEYSQLPFVRGSFRAIHADGKTSIDRNKNAAKLYREITGDKRVFACPSKCGNCMHNGMHACGNTAMSGVTVVIATH